VIFPQSDAIGGFQIFVTPMVLTAVHTTLEITNYLIDIFFISIDVSDVTEYLCLIVKIQFTQNINYVQKTWV
jgi:hypothetical protein